MSAPGCCRHCADMCAARLGAANAVHLGRHSQWGEEACPACDEAERIAQLCDEEAATAGPERLPDHDARAQTWQAAANLARGRR